MKKSNQPVSGLQVGLANFETDFVEDVLDGHPECFDAVEIQGVAMFVEGGKHFVEPVYEPDQVLFYGIYLHYAPGKSENVGVQCVADRRTHKDALAFARNLATRLGVEVDDLSPAN